jgi:hypothetical protein
MAHRIQTKGLCLLLNQQFGLNIILLLIKIKSQWSKPSL